jgi:hypothetical protein
LAFVTFPLLFSCPEHTSNLKTTNSIQFHMKINGWNTKKLHTMVKGSEMKCSAQEP